MSVWLYQIVIYDQRQGAPFLVIWYMKFSQKRKIFSSHTNSGNFLSDGALFLRALPARVWPAQKLIRNQDFVDCIVYTLCILVWY